MIIKICGILNRENLPEILQLKPDFLGFIFYPPSPRYVINKLSPSDLQEIPVSINKTGVFVDESISDIKEMVANYSLDYIQLHGNESVEYCKQLYSSGYKIIKAFRLNQDFNFNLLTDYRPFCQYFLFDTLSPEYGGSGKKFNWKILKKYKSGHPFLLSGGIEPSDSKEILAFSHPSFAGVDLNSQFERLPGTKDVDKLKVFINAVRKDS